jgi:hypothetical protein
MFYMYNNNIYVLLLHIYKKSVRNVLSEHERAQKIAIKLDFIKTIT